MNDNRPLTGVLCAVTAIFLLDAAPSHSQQLIVDDATLSAHRSVHAEGWYGTEESSLQAIIAAAGWLDVGPGLLANSSGRFEVNSWFLELKTIRGNLADHGRAVGLVAAAVMDMYGSLRGYYTYVPYSFKLAGGSSVIHLNAGIEETNTDNRPVLFTAGVRHDLNISERTLILAELFAFGPENLSYQAGFRFKIIPSILVSEITYGSGLRSSNRYPGFNIGLVFTPHNL